MKEKFLLIILFIASGTPPYIIVKTFVFLFGEGFWAAILSYPVALLVWAYTLIELGKMLKNNNIGEEDR